MFNTLGNILVSPNCGLLFVGFQQGHTLQLSGRAEIIWDSSLVDQFEGAERAVHFAVERVIEIRDATGLRMTI
jgi:hypothetical protein